MKLFRISAAVAVIALAAAALSQEVTAQTQPLPGAKNANGSAATVTGSAIVAAPAGGGAGLGVVVAPDAPLPVGGRITTTVVAQTVTASQAYSSGNAVGGLVTVGGAARDANPSGLLQSVLVYSASLQTAPIDVFVFNATPSASTCTDRTAFNLAAADLSKVVAVVHVTDWVAGGSTRSLGQAQNLAVPYVLPGGSTAGRSLYACLVVRGTPTYGATTDISVGFRMLRN